ncbi:NUDIX domain-containing protein [Salinarimonas sp.]|uniref:NUDIX domain-containing protein n=1 Tax=Salinarimonas sp. TaxID=2766526 RepID=UPI0032D904FF
MPLPLVASTHLVHTIDGAHLLVRRAGTRYFPGWLSCVAGHVEDGECPRTALVREVEEEIGVRLVPDELAFRVVVHRRLPDRTYVDFFFVAGRLPHEPMIREPDKISELVWARPEDLRSEIVPYVAAALASEDGFVAFSEA